MTPLDLDEYIVPMEQFKTHLNQLGKITSRSADLRTKILLWVTPIFPNLAPEHQGEIYQLLERFYDALEDEHETLQMLQQDTVNIVTMLKKKTRIILELLEQIEKIQSTDKDQT